MTGPASAQKFTAKGMWPNIKLSLAMVGWLGSYIKRASLPIKSVLFLSLLSFVLQGSLALTLIGSAKLLSGENISVQGFSIPRVEDENHAVLIAVSMISLIMMFSAVATLTMNYKLRMLGRKTHVNILIQILDLFPACLALQKKTPTEINRLLYQATLHTGIAVETIFQSIQPLLMLTFATITLLALDSVLMVILITSVLPIIPLYAVQAKKLVKLSENFHGKSASEFAQVYSDYIGRVTKQNFFTSVGGEAADKMSDPRFDTYLNDYDNIVLANDKMTFTFAAYRPVLFAVVLIYVAITYPLNADSSLIIIPLLFAVFYFSNSGISFIASGTNLIRLLPQVKLVYDVFESEIITPDSWHFNEFDFSGIAYCHVYCDVDNRTVIELSDSYCQQFDEELKFCFVSQAFRASEMTVMEVLCAGDLANMPVVNKLLDRWGAVSFYERLSEGGATAYSNDTFSELTPKERALFHLVPSAFALEGSLVFIDESALRWFDRAEYDDIIEYFSSGNTLIRCDAQSLLRHDHLRCFLFSANREVSAVTHETLLTQCQVQYNDLTSSQVLMSSDSIII